MKLVLILPPGTSQESQAANPQLAAAGRAPFIACPPPGCTSPPLSVSAHKKPELQLISAESWSLLAPSCPAKGATREDGRYLHLPTLGMVKKETHFSLRSAEAACVQVPDPCSGWWQYQCLLHHTYIIVRQNSQVPAPRSLDLDTEIFGCAAVALIPRLPPPCP